MSVLNPLSLNCWVLGEDTENVFPVKISRTETVGVLKDTIKDKKRPLFDHVTADSLVLWKLSIPATDFEQRAEHIARPKDIEALERSEKLKAVKKLSAYFESPPDEYIHVIVVS